MFFALKGLLFETVRARAKRIQFGVHHGKKKYLMKIFHFWSCALEKSANSAFLGQKGLFSEMVRARGIRTIILGSPLEKNVFDGKFV